jgi:hypothetical protein
MTRWTGVGGGVEPSAQVDGRRKREVASGILPEGTTQSKALV